MRAGRVPAVATDLYLRRGDGVRLASPPALRDLSVGPAKSGRANSVPAESGPANPGPALRWAMAAGLFAIYAKLALLNQARLHTTGFDLGIFEQAVRSYAHGHLPVAELKGPGFPLLGDHFSPVLAVLAPVYRVFPGAGTLLVAQAALLAVAVVPLVGWAQ